MKTEFKEVKLEDLTRDMGPELMDFVMQNAHNAVHEDSMPVGKQKKSAPTEGLSPLDVKKKRRTS